MIPIRILLVDDEKELCELLKRGLVHLNKGYDISYVHDGEQAIRFLEKEAVDILVTDIRMPGVDGIELLRAAMKLHPGIAPIIITGHGDLDNAIEALRLGAVNFIRKPVSHEILHLSILKAFEKQELVGKLADSELMFRKITSSAYDGIVLVTPDGKLSYWNEAAAAMFNVSETDALGSDLTNWLDPVSYDHFFNDLTAYLTRDEFEVVNENLEMLGHRPDGSNFPCELSLSRIKIKDVWNGVGIIRDISERKKAEEELQTGFLRLQKSLEGTVSVLATVAEKRDPYTAGHQQRVAGLSCAIAREMGFSDDQIEGLRVSGVLHDIGKMSVPAEILSKPGRLSKLEYGIIQEHSEVGFEILQDVEFPWPVAEIVLQHHERMDGSGYPNGLKGKDLLPEARILAVADVVEAMSSHRPYRTALGIDKALKEIKRGRGKIYDSAAVDACILLFTEKGFELES